MVPIGASSTWRWFGYDNAWVEIDGYRMQAAGGGGGHWGGGMFINAYDMARFGYLFLRNGKWKDRQIVSEKWIEMVAAGTSQRRLRLRQLVLNTGKKALRPHRKRSSRSMATVRTSSTSIGTTTLSPSTLDRRRRRDERVRREDARVNEVGVDIAAVDSDNSPCTGAGALQPPLAGYPGEIRRTRRSLGEGGHPRRELTLMPRGRPLGMAAGASGNRRAQIEGGHLADVTHEEVPAGHRRVVPRFPSSTGKRTISSWRSGVARTSTRSQSSVRTIRWAACKQH